jgi:hypothetical protein
VTIANVPVVGKLVAASVIGGFGAHLGLVVLVLVARDRTVMGAEPIPGRRRSPAGWSLSSSVAFGYWLSSEATATA